MATVTAFLQHTNIGKSKQAEPYTAAAHARYVMRKNAASIIYSERMPKQYHAVQRFLTNHEDGIRRNGRTLDKFIISIPHSVAEGDAVKALRRFGNHLGKGQAPFLFALHGMETKNRHAHFLYIDRADGHRVFGTSERGSSHRIKLIWEEAANGTFAELGYDVRVKVHDGVAEEQAPAPEIADNDNHIEDALEMVSAGGEEIAVDGGGETGENRLSDDPILAPTLDSDGEGEDAPLQPVSEVEREDDSDESAPIETADGDDDMDGFIQYPGLDLENPVHALKAIYLARQDLSEVRLAKERLQEAEERYAHRVAAREKAAEEASAHLAEKLTPAQTDAYQAQQDFAPHQTSRGGLKGFGVRLFGWEVKTRARKQAEVALDRVQTNQQVAQRLKVDQQAYDHEVGVQHSLALAAEREAEQRRNHILGVYGSEKEMQAAERTFENTVARAAEGLTMEEVMMAALEKEVTLDHVRAYVEATGNRAILDAFDEGIKMDDGESL